MLPSAWGGGGASRTMGTTRWRSGRCLAPKAACCSQMDGCLSPWAHLGSSHLNCWQFSPPAHTHSHTHSIPAVPKGRQGPVLRTTAGAVLKVPEPQRPTLQQGGAGDSGTQPETGGCLPQTPMQTGLHGTATLSLQAWPSGPLVWSPQQGAQRLPHVTPSASRPELGLESGVR